MRQSIIPVEFSVMAITSQDWLTETVCPQRKTSSAFLTIAVSPQERVYFFRDLITGTALFINVNNTFKLIDRDGYNSGIVRANQMNFNRNDVSIWHQDQRFSFTCTANLHTSFCFGWLVDRRFSKSLRILDPGRAA
ncbi:MAG: hypothetical protein R6U37_07475 [Dehalococcoidia bacterium]